MPKGRTFGYPTSERTIGMWWECEAPHCVLCHVVIPEDSEVPFIWRRVDPWKPPACIVGLGVLHIQLHFRDSLRRYKHALGLCLGGCQSQARRVHMWAWIVRFHVTRREPAWEFSLFLFFNNPFRYWEDVLAYSCVSTAIEVWIMPGRELNKGKYTSLAKAPANIPKKKKPPILTPCISRYKYLNLTFRFITTGTQKPDSSQGPQRKCLHLNAFQKQGQRVSWQGYIKP